MGREKTVGTVALIFGFTALGKIIGLLREVGMAARFGAGSVTDAYLAAGTVITLFLNLLGGRTLGTAFIPVYSGLTAAGLQERANRFTGTIFYLTLFVFICAALLCFLMADQLVSVVVPGFPEHTRESAVFFTRLLAAGIPLLTLAGYFSALLNLRGHFAVPAALGIPFNLAIIFFIIQPQAGAFELAAGTLAGYLLQVLVLLPVMKKNQVWIFTRPDIREPGVFKVGGLLLPIVAGGMFTQLNPLVTRAVASRLQEGAISALGYADRLIQVPLGLLVTAVITAGYPALSGAFAADNSAKARKMVISWSGALLFGIIPIACGLAFFSLTLVMLVFQRGAFTVEAASATAGALFYYSLGLPFMAWGRLLARVFYASGDSKTPMMIGAAAVGANIVCCLVLAGPMGHCGIALATTLASLGSLLLSLHYLGIKKGILICRTLRGKLTGILFSAVIQVLIMLEFSYLVGGGEREPVAEALYMVLTGGAGLVGYFLSAWLLHLDEAVFVVSFCKKRLFGRGNL